MHTVCNSWGTRNTQLPWGFTEFGLSVRHKQYGMNIGAVRHHETKKKCNDMKINAFTDFGHVV